MGFPVEEVYAYTLFTRHPPSSLSGKHNQVKSMLVSVAESVLSLHRDKSELKKGISGAMCNFL